MIWNYAELSKMAKEAGGPEQLVDSLVSSSKASGRREMLPWIFFAAFLGGGAVWTSEKIKSLYAKSREHRQVIDDTRQQLIREMEAKTKISSANTINTEEEN